MTGKVWGTRFLSGESILASMSFSNGADFPLSSFYYLSDGLSDVDYGLATISGTIAYPRNEPSRQNDRDGDVVVDYNDRDDDGDGILDLDEPDCDSDGVSDDLDLDDVAC